MRCSLEKGKSTPAAGFALDQSQPSESPELVVADRLAVGARMVQCGVAQALQHAAVMVELGAEPTAFIGDSPAMSCLGGEGKRRVAAEIVAAGNQAEADAEDSFRKSAFGFSRSKSTGQRGTVICFRPWAARSLDLWRAPATPRRGRGPPDGDEASRIGADPGVR